MTRKEPTESQCLKTRDVLWYLVFFGFAVNYMIRINLNIAIVSMVKARPKVDSISACPHEQFRNETSKKVEDINWAFDWDEYQQGLILGSFFWFHWFTQVPGGLLAQKFGTKLVFGLSNFSGVLCSFFLPWAAYRGFEYLIFLRFLQGILTGFSWPSMHNMTAKWIPPNERSKFVTAYLGSSVGAALTFPMCGYIIDIWNWEAVFYVSGILGTLWYISWCLLVFDSPSEHPRISEGEKDYILASLGASVSKEKAPIPWKKMIKSVPMWMNILAQWGGIWGLFTLMTHAPTYFKVIHGWNIRATGIFSGLPHLIRMLWAYVFSLIGDYLLKAEKMSRTNVRKLATAVCCIGQGVCMLGLAYSGCDYTAAIIFLTAATAVHGAVSTGPLASFIDLSPNYASVQLGLSGMITVLPGFISPSIVGLLTYNNQTVEQWQKVFWISAGMLLISGILYVIFSKSEVQKWNTPSTRVEEISREELEKLKGQKDGEQVIELEWASQIIHEVKEK